MLGPRSFTRPGAVEPTTRRPPSRWPFDGVRDAPLYLVFAVCAAAMWVTSGSPAQALWGWAATAAYLVAAVASLLAGRVAEERHRVVRLRILAGAAIGSVVAPLVVLLVLRACGLAWAGHIELDVIENAARTLLGTGSPYVDAADVARPLTMSDYMPYMPGMALFGLPRALFGAGVLTDPRIGFVAVGAACGYWALRTYRHTTTPADRRALPVPVLAVSPLTGLMVAGGQDSPVIALLVAAAVAAHARRPVACGLLVAAAVTLKTTAVPMLFLLVVLHAGRGRRECARFLAPTAAVLLVCAIPVLRNVDAFVEQTIRFPAGSGDVAFPAATPFPGYLLTHAVSWGRTATTALLLMVAAVIMIAVLRRGVPDAAAALGWFAVGISAATLLDPMTRPGYLVYPVLACAAAVLLRRRLVPVAVPARAPVGIHPPTGEPARISYS